MNENQAPMVRSNPAVAKLNQVAGFDPVKLLQKVLTGKAQSEGEALQLILRYKKLWFRLACPQGRIKLNALRITEQLAIIEAKVYLNKEDSEPVANFTAERTAQDTPGGLYIQAAQYEAQDNALTDAGFGIQLCDVCQTMGETAYVPKQQSAVPGTTAPVQTPVETPPRQEVQSEPVSGASEKSISAETAPPKPEAEAGETPQASSEDETRVDTPAPPVVEAPPAETPSMEETAFPEENTDAQPDGEQPVPTPTGGPAGLSAEVPAPNAGTVAYTPGMSVDEICGSMTLEEARNIIADVGMCRGQTLAQIADRRPASLRWYVYGCNEASNILKAGAKLVLEGLSASNAA